MKKQSLRQPTLLGTLFAHRDDKIAHFAYHEERHFEAVARSKGKEQEYAGIVVDMLMGRSGSKTNHPNWRTLINKHILYCPGDKVLPIHNLAYQFYLIGGYLTTYADIRDETVKDMLASHSVTNDAKGRVMELYVIERMKSLQTFDFYAKRIDANGNLGAQNKFRAKDLTIKYFPTQSVPYDIQWNRNWLLIPLNSNYPGADVLLWDARQQLLVAVQFTAGIVHKHANSFFTGANPLVDRWKTASGAKKFWFVWVAPQPTVSAANSGHYYASLTDLQHTIAPLLSYFAQ
jgi:hypothetical protein